MQFATCRPKSEEFDIDASAFALRCALEPMIIEDAARRIVQFATNKPYDALLIDRSRRLSRSTAHTVWEYSAWEASSVGVASKNDTNGQQ
ncbi:hypothetical protein [Dendronalium sp. ChiSLP03b]|uniref:hypothetical protein n=1 Tax=Dendronalium sp. ChiSLP03b TaxID=3075381 RepID=UPI002AD886B2|nr:hypothetical protein [Dendronalium sp. ChiSLP03b]